MEFVAQNRLDQVVIEASGHGPVFLLLLVVAADGDQLGLRVAAAQMPGHLITTHAR
jgi:hypothetical protein